MFIDFLFKYKTNDKKLILEKLKGSNPFIYWNFTIKIIVKKCDGFKQIEYKKFCVDPQITSFEMLQNLLARAFSINGDFTISYLIEENGEMLYASLLSDWDMDAAFQSASDPYLRLKVDLKPFDESLEDWDVIAPLDIPANRLVRLFDKSSALLSITDTISSRLEKTVMQVHRAIGRKKSDVFKPYEPLKPPMCDREFHNFLDAEGRLVHPQKFRLSVYQGGIEPCLRRVAWRHLLNIFPPCLTGRERFEYMKEREYQYYSLRDEWKKHFASSSCPEHFLHVISLVKKDVLRTDRTHEFYAGADDNKNIVSLFHILVTYAITHPSVSYCQGMSDIASPILVVQKDEAQAYICFCSVMGRLHRNFLPDGKAMTTKFKHLAHLVNASDPVFYQYLSRHNMQDLFFCYRWLLLETKREFPLDDALYMLEVMWSTHKPPPPSHEITLSDPDYYTVTMSILPASPITKETVYAKFLTRHRQNSVYKSPLASKKLQADEKEDDRSHDDVDEDDKDSCSASSERITHDSVNNNLSPCIYEEDFISEMSDDFSSVDITQSVRHKSSLIDESLKCSPIFLNDGTVGRVMIRLSSSSSDGELDTVNIDLCDDQHSHEHHGCKDDDHVTVEHDPDSSFVDISHESLSDIPNSSNFDNNATSEADLIMVDERQRHNLTINSSGQYSETTADLPDNNSELSSNFTSYDRQGDTHDVVSLSNGRQSDISQTGDSESFENVYNDRQNTDGHEDSGQEESDDSSVGINGDGSLTLPPPSSFGDCNPFLMFICLTMFLQHRDYIMRNNLDFDETAIHFDKMVRKHQVDRVLHQTRLLYCEYLRDQQRIAADLDESEDSL